MDLVTTDKSLVGTLWKNRITGEQVQVKEQFRVGSDLDSWCDCRDDNNVCHMMTSTQLVKNYSRIA